MGCDLYCRSRDLGFSLQGPSHEVKSQKACDLRGQEESSLDLHLPCCNPCSLTNADDSSFGLFRQHVIPAGAMFRLCISLCACSLADTELVVSCT